jgi:hypothetical protein
MSESRKLTAIRISNAVIYKIYEILKVDYVLCSLYVNTENFLCINNCQVFPHCNILKFYLTSPDGKICKQIYQWISNIICIVFLQIAFGGYGLVSSGSG